MSHLLVCGGAGFTNLGDDAILWGMLTQLRAACDRPIRVVGGPELTSLTSAFGATAMTYDDREELSRAIEDADLVILGGGGMIYDIGYGATLARFLTDPPDRQWLYELARIAAAARAAGKPVMCYAVGCGPLLTTAARQVAAFIAEQSSAITVRDQSSADLLAGCGVSASRVYVSADPAVVVEPGSSEAADQWLSESGVRDLPRPWVAVNLRPWYGSGQEGPEAGDRMEALIAKAGELVRGIRERLGGTAALLPFQRLYDDDGEVAQRVMGAAGEGAAAIIADPPPRPPDLVAAFSRFDLVVGMRMHVLLLALSAGVPFVALSYGKKVEEVARAAGLGDHLHAVDELDPESALQSCEVLLSERDAVCHGLQRARAELREAAQIPAALAASILEARGVTRSTALARAAGMEAAAVRQPRRETTGLRVLMQIRPDYQERPGGDVVQLAELLPYLREAGVRAELSGEPAPDLSGYDLVHTINLDRPDEPYRHCLNAVQQGKPVVISTVHTDLSEFLDWASTRYWRLPEPGEGDPEPQPAPSSHPSEVRRRALEHLQRQAIVDWSSAYLPNAQVNADYLHRVFAIDLTRTVVVPNGVRAACFAASPDLFVSRYGLRDFVLCVGRVEAKKNQLCLVAAMRGLGIPLVVVGIGNPPEYLELCRRYADDNAHFLSWLSDEELASAYAAAKVHALTSWIELPGLTTLEAAAAGCNIVSTDRGSPPEYLGEMAWYCDPRSVDSIREAVLAAYRAPRSDSLRQHVRARFTWERAAQKTLEGYQLALAVWERQEEAGRSAAPLRALQSHADWLARQVADREYEVRQAHQRLSEAEAHIAHLRAWGEQWQGQSQAVEAELKRWQEEFERVTSRRLFRWSEALARGGWAILRKLGIRP